MKVENICVKTLITINKKTPCKIAAKLMLKHGIGSLIVVSQNEPIGIVTRGDLITKIFDNKEKENIEVGDIMSRNLINTEETTEVLNAAELLVKYNIKHLLVTKSKLTPKISRIASLNLIDKKPDSVVQIIPPMVGVISASDILKRLEILSAEKKFKDQIHSHRL